MYILLNVDVSTMYDTSLHREKYSLLNDILLFI